MRSSDGALGFSFSGVKKEPTPSSLTDRQKHSEAWKLEHMQEPNSVNTRQEQTPDTLTSARKGGGMGFPHFRRTNEEQIISSLSTRQKDGISMIYIYIILIYSSLKT